MARWQPNALERLQQAALELFQEHGYARTTVGEIAGRAGLTERTFFRYFTDKREVLFSGAGQLQALLADAIIAAPPTALPLDAVGAGLAAAAAGLEGRRVHALARQAVISAYPELMERELMKLAALAATVADALRQRGVAEPAASLAAEAGIAVFKVAFKGWLEDEPPRALAHYLRSALGELKALTNERPMDA